MGDHDVNTEFEGAQRRAFMRHLFNDLHALSHLGAYALAAVQGTGRSSHGHASGASHVTKRHIVHQVLLPVVLASLLWDTLAFSHSIG